jgi:hypothetical protein
MSPRHLPIGLLIHTNKPTTASYLDRMKFQKHCKNGQVYMIVNIIQIQNVTKISSAAW